MLFSSFLFLFGFLPVFLACYYGGPARLRNFVALIASLFFYAWGEPLFAVVLVVSSVLDQLLVHRLLTPAAGAPDRRRGWLALGIVYNLGLLIVCKYANFFVAQYNVAAGWIDFPAITGWREIPLPVGVSFFTFHKISYLVDVYRGKARPTQSVSDYILYIALFPQLVAGPIIRYSDVETQLRSREHTIDKFLAGLWRFSTGFGRKILIANPLGDVADRIFGVDPANVPAHYAWLGIACYTLQIYFDFSGYSSMALGLGRMMGFEFKENFNLPYTARSITEFWRRWHISLSSFLRDYLYIPLGGNRVGPVRQAANLWIVFLLSGFWHGATWSFVVWGAWHGLWLTVEKVIGLSRLERMPAALRWAWAMLLVMIGWVFFRAPTLTHATGYLAAMFPWFGGSSATNAAATAATVSAKLPALPSFAELVMNRTWFVLALGAVLAAIPEERWRAWGWLDEHASTTGRRRARFIVGATLFLLACGALATGGYNPFIYWRT